MSGKTIKILKLTKLARKTVKFCKSIEKRYLNPKKAGKPVKKEN